MRKLIIIITFALVSVSAILFAPTANAQEQCVPGTNVYGIPCEPCVPGPYGICVPIPDTGIIVGQSSAISAELVLLAFVMFGIGVILYTNGSLISKAVSN